MKLPKTKLVVECLDLNNIPQRTPGKCEGRVKTFWGYCDREATIVIEGKGYCWQHNPNRNGTPEEAQQRRIAAHAEQETRRDAWDRRRNLEEKAGVKNLSEADLAFLASIGGIREVINQLQNN